MKEATQPLKFIVLGLCPLLGCAPGPVPKAMLFEGSSGHEIVGGERVVPIEMLSRAGLLVNGEVVRGTKYGDIPNPELGITTDYIVSRAGGFDASKNVEILLTGHLEQNPIRKTWNPSAWVADIPDSVSGAPPSGLPLADASWYQTSVSYRRLFFRGVYEDGRVQIHRKYVRTATGRSVPPAWDAKPFEPVIEAAARTYFARLVGERLEPSTAGRVHGSQVTAFECRFSGQRYFDLESWAAARGLVSSRDDVPSATLRGGGTDLLVPLGAKSVKLGGRWLDLPDCVAEKDGRWLVPATLDGLVP